MNTFNVFMIGVGGQGIGLLSEVLIRAADRAGHRVKGVDTHGLAQRGGPVISHLRLGDEVDNSLTGTITLVGNDISIQPRAYLPQGTVATEDACGGRCYDK